MKKRTFGQDQLCVGDICEMRDKRPVEIEPGVWRQRAYHVRCIIRCVEIRKNDGAILVGVATEMSNFHGPVAPDGFYVEPACFRFHCDLRLA